MNRVSETPSTCPICRKRPVREKRKYRLYGEYVCRKCLYRLANRRQAAFLIDYILWGILVYVPLAAVEMLVGLGTPGWVLPDPVAMAIGFVSMFAFGMKDGFSGHSPGKWLCGVQVVDASSMEPIGFGQSLIRNMPVLLIFAPYYIISNFWPMLIMLGSLFQLLGLVIIGSRLVKGARWGDGWAKTKVVWKQYVHRVPFDFRGEVCRNCGYDLRGNVSGICPECGEAIVHAARPVDGPPATTSAQQGDRKS